MRKSGAGPLRKSLLGPWARHHQGPCTRRFVTRQGVCHRGLQCSCQMPWQVQNIEGETDSTHFLYPLRLSQPTCIARGYMRKADPKCMPRIMPHG